MWPNFYLDEANVRQPYSWYEESMRWSEERLGSILTLSEVAYLWDKAKGSVFWHCERGNFRYRKSITGGAVLIMVEDVLRLWGEPTFRDFDILYIPEEPESI